MVIPKKVRLVISQYEKLVFTLSFRKMTSEVWQSQGGGEQDSELQGYINYVNQIKLSINIFLILLLEIITNVCPILSIHCRERGECRDDGDGVVGQVDPRDMMVTILGGGRTVT